MGNSPWGHKELNTTEQLSKHTHTHTMRIKSIVPESSVLYGMTASRKKYRVERGSSRQNKRGAINTG